jgi:hypothetical protein
MAWCSVKSTGTTLHRKIIEIKLANLNDIREVATEHYVKYRPNVTVHPPNTKLHQNPLTGFADKTGLPHYAFILCTFCEECKEGHVLSTVGRILPLHKLLH